ncbi:STAS domain-containing protein [Yinghuangia sp. YIM S09857]|uniref:STAS domain-containing protein n=1 Tax=Yinghuangia sp. YIM S09857 TaxID=3436929 RepID=UPI003F534198
MKVRVVAGAVVVEIGALVRADVPGLCARVDEMLVQVPGARLVCDVGADCRADLALVDALARLRLAARRRGRAYQIRDAPPALTDLLGLVGLRGAVPVAGTAPPPRPAGPPRTSHGAAIRAAPETTSKAPTPACPDRAALRLQPVRQPEQREQVVGVEERVEPDDPSV